MAGPAVRRAKVAYGDHPSQFGHLYLPAADPSAASPAGPAPLVVLVHGGSWSTEYSLVVYTAIARDLAARGAVVWNLEYRRVGEPGGGWPGTARDVVAGLRALDDAVAEELAAAGVEPAREQVRLVGHSAGGHLAVWSACELGGATREHRFSTVLAQSAPLDFTLESARGRDSIVALMGRGYEEIPDRYRAASPVFAPVIDATVVAVHTLDDEAIDPAMSRHYVAVAGMRGQRAVLREVPTGGHAAFVSPRSAAHRQTLRDLGL